MPIAPKSQIKRIQLWQAATIAANYLQLLAKRTASQKRLKK